jgi:hypothetical protein
MLGHTCGNDSELEFSHHRHFPIVTAHKVPGYLTINLFALLLKISCDYMSFYQCLKKVQAYLVFLKYLLFLFMLRKSVVRPKNLAKYIIIFRLPF